MSVELRKAGLHLTGTQLFFDAHRKSELSFVSHGHSDHIARHERVIATAATLRFMTHRLGKISAPLPVPYNRPFELGPLVLELLPAGHILGSAQLRVTRADGVRVVYTGDLNRVRSLTAEPAQVAECDVLVTESTFGHPRYVFPPKEKVLADVESWARDALARNITPVLLGYPLGKSQEAIKYLGDKGLRICAHPSIYDIAEIYQELGVTLRNVRRYAGRVHEGELAFFPPNVARGAAVAKLQPRLTALLTGWAIEGPLAAQRCGADLAFPLSDHADFPSLVEYAKSTGASEVVTHHGFADELAQSLRAEGIEARPVGRTHQLSLKF
ncbi:MAG: MBL fold metallo-hydrolase [Myxococcaceae bacterium]